MWSMNRACLSLNEGWDIPWIEGRAAGTHDWGKEEQKNVCDNAVHRIIKVRKKH